MDLENLKFPKFPEQEIHGSTGHINAVYEPIEQASNALKTSLLGCLTANEFMIADPGDVEEKLINSTLTRSKRAHNLVSVAGQYIGKSISHEPEFFVGYYPSYLLPEELAKGVDEKVNILGPGVRIIHRLQVLQVGLVVLYEPVVVTFSTGIRYSLAINSTGKATVRFGAYSTKLINPDDLASVKSQLSSPADRFNASDIPKDFTRNY